MKTVTITITPEIKAFEKAMKRMGYAAEGALRKVKKLNRKFNILRKQVTRDGHKANRRKPLIHNGRKAR